MFKPRPNLWLDLFSVVSSSNPWPRLYNPTGFATAGQLGFSTLFCLFKLFLSVIGSTLLPKERKFLFLIFFKKAKITAGLAY